MVVAVFNFISSIRSGNALFLLTNPGILSNNYSYGPTKVMAQPTSFDKAIAQLYRDYLELLNAFGDLGTLLQQAAEDVALRQRLVRTSNQVLLEKGVALPEGTEIEFLENTSERMHLILPALADKVPAVATPNPVKRAIARACGDSAYRALLLTDPRRAFAETNCEVPETVEVSVREMPVGKLLVVLPEFPDVVLGQARSRLPMQTDPEVPAGLSLEWQGSTLVAAGRIDAITAPTLRRELERAERDVDMVLAAVTFIGSAGLGALLAGQKHLVANGCTLRLVDVSEPVCTALETVGFIDLFEIIDRGRQKTAAAKQTDVEQLARLFLDASTSTRAYGRLRPHEALSVSFSDVQQARQRIANLVLVTPLAYSEKLSAMTDCRLYLKLENLQMTGAYKERGAFSKTLHLSEQEKRIGIVTSSAGNHAQAVAYAAKRIGIPASIVMPETTPLSKVQGTQAFGPSIVLHGDNYDAAFQRAKELQQQQGYTFIHAFDDPDVIAGQGSIGLELLEQNPYLDVIVVPIGGGGLISGIAVAIKETNPKIRIIGVEAAAMPGMHASLAAGKVTTISSSSTIAEGIAVATVGSYTFPIVQKYVDDIVTVTEEEIANAVLLLLEQEKTLVEGAGSVGLGALCNRKIQGVAGKNVAVVVSGGNIDLNMLSKILERGRVKDGRLTHLRVVLPDKPGSLIELSALLADHRANVLQIVHERSFSQANLGEVEVSFTLETKGHQHAQEIVKALSEKGFHLITSSDRRKTA
jgi:threonine dehydratase